MNRDIVIGDVHGCIEELNELLRKVEYTRTDRLVFVGDLVDRGPDSVGVVRRVRELGAECVMGNHDEWYVRCFKHELANVVTGKKNPLRENAKKFEVYKTLDTDDLRWMSKLPYYLKLDDKTVVVHAGLRAGVPLEEQHPNEMLRLRYVNNATGKMVSDHVKGETTFWAMLWTGPENVIFGHHPSKGEAWVVRDGKLGPVTRCSCNDPDDNMVKCWGIDTGCVFGNKLTAWVRTDDGKVELVSVPARKPYALWHESMREEK